MFSGFAVYVGERIVLMLRDSPKQPKDNGVWLVFSETANLADPGIRRDFPSLRLIDLLGGKLLTGGSSLPRARPSSRKPCTPASFSSNTTCGSDASHSLARHAQPNSVASDYPRRTWRIARVISACRESLLLDTAPPRHFSDACEIWQPGIIGSDFQISFFAALVSTVEATVERAGDEAERFVRQCLANPIDSVETGCFRQSHAQL